MKKEDEKSKLRRVVTKTIEEASSEGVNFPSAIALWIVDDLVKVYDIKPLAHLIGHVLNNEAFCLSCTPEDKAKRFRMIPIYSNAAKIYYCIKCKNNLRTYSF